MTRRSKLRGPVLCLAIGMTLLAAACGGRVRQTILVDDDGNPIEVAGGGSGGSTPVGRAGSAPVAGAPTAGAAAAGAPGAGGNSPCACPALGCPSGTHPMFLPGQCCPICVDDPATSCEDGKVGYQQAKAELLTKYEFGCMVDAECAALVTSNACELCAYVAVWSSVAQSYEANVNGFADGYCGACPPAPQVKCAPPPSAVCVSGICRLVVK